MPGTTTNFGFRYPLLGETIDATSWQNLAVDIDAVMTRINDLRTKAFHAPTASIGNTGSASLPINSATTVIADMLHNVVNWDTAGLTNIVGNPERINLTPGVWYARFTAGILQNTTTVQQATVYIREVGTGFIWAANSTSNITNPSSNVTGPLTVNAVVVYPAANSITGSVQWIGTGGPAHWTDINGSNLQVYRLREFLDV